MEIADCLVYEKGAGVCLSFITTSQADNAAIRDHYSPYSSAIIDLPGGPHNGK